MSHHKIREKSVYNIIFYIFRACFPAVIFARRQCTSMVFDSLDILSRILVSNGWAIVPVTRKRLKMAPYGGKVAYCTCHIFETSSVNPTFFLFFSMSISQTSPLWSLRHMQFWSLLYTLIQFPQTFLTNSSKLTIYLCKILTVITETLMVLRAMPIFTTQLWAFFKDFPVGAFWPSCEIIY
jgi:hypothetical protein